MASQFWLDRLAATEAQILIYEAALTALGTAGIESYMLDTGQSITRVTRLDLADLNKTLSSLVNTYAMYDARCNGGNSTYMRPGF